MNVIILTPGKDGGHFPTMDPSQAQTVSVFIKSYEAKLKKFKEKPVSTELIKWFDACNKALKAAFDPFLKQARKAQNQLISGHKETVKTLKTDFWKLVFSFRQFRLHLEREMTKRELL